MGASVEAPCADKCNCKRLARGKILSETEDIANWSCQEADYFWFFFFLASFRTAVLQNMVLNTQIIHAYPLAAIVDHITKDHDSSNSTGLLTWESCCLNSLL